MAKEAPCFNRCGRKSGVLRACCCGVCGSFIARDDTLISAASIQAAAPAAAAASRTSAASIPARRVAPRSPRLASPRRWSVETRLSNSVSASPKSPRESLVSPAPRQVTASRQSHGPPVMLACLLASQKNILSASLLPPLARGPVAATAACLRAGRTAARMDPSTPTAGRTACRAGRTGGWPAQPDEATAGRLRAGGLCAEGRQAVGPMCASD